MPLTTTGAGAAGLSPRPPNAMVDGDGNDMVDGAGNNMVFE